MSLPSSAFDTENTRKDSNVPRRKNTSALREEDGDVAGRKDTNAPEREDVNVPNRQKDTDVLNIEDINVLTRNDIYKPKEKNTNEPREKDMNALGENDISVLKGNHSMQVSDIEKLSKLPQPPPPPNGGILAWSQVLGAFLLYFSSWGIVNTFGVFQSYYQTTLIPSYSPSAISWIGTVQGLLLLLFGVITGPVFDKGYLHSLICLGAFFLVFGLLMTSFSTEYYQLFLAHGISVGLGCGCLFTPSVATVATYFTTKRALATGITAAGGSIGGVIYPILFRQFLPIIGFSWTTRVFAFIELGALFISIAIMRTRFPPAKKSRSLLDLSALKEMPFVVLSIGLFLVLVGLFFPYFYLPTFTSIVLHASETTDFYMLSIINATSVLGRIIPGLIADMVGALNMMVLCGLGVTILTFTWLGISSVPGVAIFAAFYGFCQGAIVSLPVTIVAGLSPHMGVVGTRVGMIYSFAGVGILIGNPITGSLIDLETGEFWMGQLFSTAIMLAASLCFILVRILQASKGKGWKV